MSDTGHFLRSHKNLSMADLTSDNSIIASSAATVTLRIKEKLKKFRILPENASSPQSTNVNMQDEKSLLNTNPGNDSAVKKLELSVSKRSKQPFVNSTFGEEENLKLKVKELEKTVNVMQKKLKLQEEKLTSITTSVENLTMSLENGLKQSKSKKNEVAKLQKKSRVLRPIENFQTLEFNKLHKQSSKLVHGKNESLPRTLNLSKINKKKDKKEEIGISINENSQHYNLRSNKSTKQLE